jgi:hypothetical protein
MRSMYVADAVHTILAFLHEISQPFRLKGYLEHYKISPQESVQQYEIARIAIKYGSNSTAVVYRDSRRGRLFSLSWPFVPSPNEHSDIGDHVESYRIHMFLTRRLRLSFTPKDKLMIFNQESLLNVLPILCIRSTTFLFMTPPKRNAQDSYSVCNIVIFYTKNLTSYSSWEKVYADPHKSQPAQPKSNTT